MRSSPQALNPLNLSRRWRCRSRGARASRTSSRALKILESSTRVSTRLVLSKETFHCRKISVDMPISQVHTVIDWCLYSYFTWCLPCLFIVIYNILRSAIIHAYELIMTIKMKPLSLRQTSTIRTPYTTLARGAGEISEKGGLTLLSGKYSASLPLSGPSLVGSLVSRHPLRRCSSREVHTLLPPPN